MARVIVLAEGQTEVTFVNEVLGPHLAAFGHHVSGRLIGLGMLRGGIVGWPTALRDILRHLKEDRSRIVTTMVDYYALPATKENAWPGRASASPLPFAQRAITVEDAVRDAVSAEMGRNFDLTRFHPFVVMHEFEGLLFSDCTRFAEAIYKPDLTQHFQAIRDAFPTPEEINDSPVDAPSKRVLRLMPEYQKPLLGSFAADYIGLHAIRRECPHFHDWLQTLEKLPP